MVITNNTTPVFLINFISLDLNLFISRVFIYKCLILIDQIYCIGLLKLRVFFLKFKTGIYTGVNHTHIDL
jgi:hypothetical protein